MKKTSILILLALFAFGPIAWAQVPLDNIPAEVNAEDATITELGHATMTVKVKIVTDSLTHHTDTLCNGTLQVAPPTNATPSEATAPTARSSTAKTTTHGSTSIGTGSIILPSMLKADLCCSAR